MGVHDHGQLIEVAVAGLDRAAKVLLSLVGFEEVEEALGGLVLEPGGEVVGVEVVGLCDFDGIAALVDDLNEDRGGEFVVWHQHGVQYTRYRT